MADRKNNKYLRRYISIVAFLFVCTVGGLWGQASHSAACFDSTWLEIPSSAMLDSDAYYVTHWAQMQGRRQRNYSMCYVPERYTSYWVAYPLCAAHLSTGRAESWSYDTEIPEEEQTCVVKGYGESVLTPNYTRNFYARGHQIPNADRNAVPEMLAQTYFSTNMTPQIQNGFNGGIWAQLEKAVRTAVPSNDTLYVVTGAAFGKKNEVKEIQTIVNKNDRKAIPVPNYYWKAVLKVQRSDRGVPLQAMSVGFWLPHADLKGHSYTEYTVPVDSIESWTGINLFVNLPDSIESLAELNDSWARFLKPFK